MIAPPHYLISSCVGYDAPLERLLRTMRDISDERKLVVIGGAGREEIKLVGSLPCALVTHNSFDYTALIEHCASRFSHVFLLHDTMEFGELSEDLICQADPEMEATAAYPGGQSNLICYRGDYLLKHLGYIAQLRNCTKLAAIQHEGRLWSMTERRAVYPGAGCINDGMHRPYGGEERLKEIYPAVGIVKWKRNYGQSMTHFGVKP